MIHSILAYIAGVIIFIITKTGYMGIGLLMAIDSCNIPIPSEVTMPFAGFLAQTQVLSLWGVIIAGTIGGIIGSIISYYLASWVILYRKQNKFLYTLFSDRSVYTAERWFQKYGNASVFFGRMVPVVRTFISLPAGVARMKMASFLWFTAAGSLVWSILLTYAGYILGENWHRIEIYFREVQYVVVVLIVCAGVMFLIQRKKKKNKISPSGGISV